MCVSQNLLYILLSLPVTIGQAQYHWQPALCPQTCGLSAPPIVKCVDSYGAAVADTFCNLYTKPSCEATPPCDPFWFSDDVQCPTECGRPASTVTRIVKCKGTIDDTIQVIADSYCDPYSKPPTEVHCPATYDCVTYHWKLGDETCPTQCGLLASNVTRSLVCIASDGTTVADSYCNAYAKPDRILKCPSTAPCAPFWYTSDVQCPYDCGRSETQKQRTVVCKGTVNGQVKKIADSYCAYLPKPSSTVTCPATAPCAPFWDASNVQCPTYCGLPASQVPRTVKCKGTMNGKVIELADSYCAAYTKPSTTVDCPATAPCAPFWDASDVPCPTYCGLPASQVPRTVKCKGTMNNQVVDLADSFCAALPKPSTTVYCNATAPCAPFWDASDVPCPTYCGLPASQVPRTVKCKGTMNNQVVDLADSYCAALPKPSTTVYCNATAPCAPFWDASDVPCPTYCGLLASQVPRTVKCKGTMNNQVVDLADSYCAALPKPSTTVYCNATAPCAPFWDASDVPCPTYCGLPASQVPRTVKCKGTMNNQVVDLADSYCAALPKPSTTVDCNATAPCAPFWDASDVPCPTYCGLPASQVPRTVKCKGTINNQVVEIADSYCAALPKPSTTVYCDATAPCAPFWDASDVPCPTYCGLPASQVPRSVKCKGTINNQVVEIADSYCAALPKPSTTVYCDATAPCAPFWDAPDVPCPTYCGFPASQVSRTVKCKGTMNNQVVDIADSYCDANTKPSTTVYCNATAPCAPFWDASDVPCPTYCGLPASQVPRAVKCKGTMNNQVVDLADSYCAALPKPSTTVYCDATAPCAPFWDASDVPCPTYCGLPASQVPRSVKCKGTMNNQVVEVADSYCDSKTKPSATVYCNATAPCAPFWDASDVPCPTYCGLPASDVSRTVKCKGTMSNQVVDLADSYCAALPKPSSTVHCNATAPCAPYWFTSDVVCPTYCGIPASDVTRTVVCKGTVNGVEVVIADSYCSSPKPSATVHCTATQECVSYEWKVSNEYCPTDCGRLPSTVTLTLTCLAKTSSHPEGTPVDHSFCAGLTKPGTTLSCDATPPCAPYWFTGPVNCPTECGKPATTVTRVVECRGTVNGQVIKVDDYLCSGPKPSATVPCPATEVCVIYQWKLGDAYCPSECGHAASQVMRPLVCVAITPDVPAGNPVADSFCNAYTKPDATMQCPATENCCAATNTPCSYDNDCCSGVCVLAQAEQPSYPDTKGKNTKGKYTKGTKATKVTKGPYDDSSENPYESKDTKGTKATKSTKGTKTSPTYVSGSYDGGSSKSTKGKSTYSKQDSGKKRGYEVPKGTCGCLKSAASCTKDAQCCSGSCKNYVCAPTSNYKANDDSQRSGNAGVAVGVGVGGAFGAALAVGFVMRRRRRSKNMSREDRAASEPLTPHTKATTTPRKVDVVA